MNNITITYFYMTFLYTHFVVGLHTNKTNNIMLVIHDIVCVNLK